MEQTTFFNHIEPLDGGFLPPYGAFLSSEEILSLQSDTPLITPFDPAQLEFLEGSAYDLRVDKVFEFPILDGAHWKTQVPFVGKDYRRTPAVSELSPSDHLIMVDKKPIEFSGWHLEGVRSYLVQTVETVSIPRYLFAMCDSRTTVFRSAAWLFATPVRPGYTGVLTFGLHVSSLDGIYIERGSRIASMMVGRLGVGNTGTYKGKWGDASGNMPGTDGKGREAY